MRGCLTAILAGASLLSGIVSAAPVSPNSGHGIPNPTKGFFPQSAYDTKVYGKLNVIRNGKKDGCWANWGSWTRDENSCGKYIVRWNEPKSKTAFKLMATQPEGDLYPVTYNYNKNHPGKIYTSNYIPGTDFYANGEKLAAPLNKWAGGGGPAWSTKFYATQEPTDHKESHIWTAKKPIEFEVEWETIGS